MMRFRLFSALLVSSTAIVTGSVSGCATPDPPEYVTGLQDDSVEFHIFDTTQGIYPSDAVTKDPNNPFLNGPPTDEAKWAITAQGSTALAFYAWATELAWAPTGEAQYYTATNLRDAYTLRLVDNKDLETLKSMAVEAFQSVLDNFPESVTYLPDGKSYFFLAPRAYNEIKALGETPTGPWQEVATPDGDTTVVRVTP